MYAPSMFSDLISILMYLEALSSWLLAQKKVEGAVVSTKM